MFHWEGMTETHARQIVADYRATFATNDAERLDRHYETGAILVPKPGHPVSGPQQRIAAHRHLLGFGLPIEAQARHVYVAGDISLVIADWSIRGTAAQGFPVDLRGTATDVARRGADGRWRYVIDNPFGVA
jgi:ketosteroid isomerase-like protein